MAERSRPHWRRWLLLLLSAVVMAACLAVELGSRLPGSEIPGWEAIYRALGLAPASAEGVLEVHFIDVGNADCALLRQGEYAALIDAGEPGDGEDIVDYLRRCGVDRLDFLLVSHGHADHVGGMKAVLAALPVGRLLVGDMPTAESDQVYTDLLAAAGEMAVPVETVQAEAVYTLGEATLQVLSAMIVAEDENDRSVVVRLTLGERAFLFTGDAGKAVERALLRSKSTLQADVLKIGHHGGDTASSIAFLRQVRPVYGVVPCGANNLHGHPSVTVLQRLQELGVICLRSDTAGDIVFTTDGQSLTVETALDE